MDVQERVERLIVKGTGCSAKDAARVARALAKYGLLSGAGSTGYLVEMYDEDRWWRINGWIYDNREGALGIAQRQRDHTGHTHRVMVMSHTEPRVVKTFKAKT